MRFRNAILAINITVLLAVLTFQLTVLQPGITRNERGLTQLERSYEERLSAQSRLSDAREQTAYQCGFLAGVKKTIEIASLPVTIAGGDEVCKNVQRSPR